MKQLTLLIKPASGLCNMHCQYCFYQSAGKERDQQIITKDTVDMLIRKVKAYRPAALTVMFQGGEPLLAGLDYYKYFVTACNNALPVPVNYALQTNGLLMDDALVKFFKKHQFLLGISLDGNEKTNDRYRLDLSKKSVLSRIISACKLLDRSGVAYNILSVIDDKNAAEIESTWEYFKSNGFRYLQFIPCIDEDNGVSLSSEAYERFLKKSFDLWYAEWTKGNYISVRHIDNYINILLGNPPENCAMCGVCGSYFVVESDGALYPCDFYCTEQYKLGSIFEDDPFETNEKQREFIEKSRRIHKQCNTCRFYILCRGGCRRDRTDNYTSNKYCAAYQSFFKYAVDRMTAVAKELLYD